MPALMRARDWSTTSIGAIDTWPQSLKTAVDIVLCTSMPALLFWGIDGVQIYNDACASFLGELHPGLLGESVQEGWPAERVLNEWVLKAGLAGESSWCRDRQLTLRRDGKSERMRTDWCFSPVPDETGEPKGVLTLIVESAARQRLQSARAEAEAARIELQQAQAQLGVRIAERAVELGRTNAVLARTNTVLAAEIAQRIRAERNRTDLLRRLASSREDEQRRIARDLHDQVGQTLTVLTLAVRAARDAGPLPPVAEQRLSDVHSAAEKLGREVHGLAVRLRPTALDDIGLTAALGQLIEEWSRHTNIDVDLQTSDLEAGRLPADVETALYRVIQEALTNVARHARARRVSVVVQRHDGKAIAVVEDDGVGCDLETEGSDRLGLIGMRERMALVGGRLDIESAPGDGTTVIARVPLLGL